MICCDQCHQYYCLTCFLRMLENNRHSCAYCAYCRNHFSKAFIWINTPDCFREDYFDGSSYRIHQYEIYEYLQNQAIKEIKQEQLKNAKCKTNEWPFDKNNTLICCQHCKEHFEYDTLIAYFTEQHKRNKNYNPECYHCHKKWNNKFMYDTFGDDFCKNILHLFDHYVCCICQCRKKLKLKNFDNTCNKCGEKFCKECLKKIINSDFNYCNRYCKKCNSFIFNKFKDYNICQCGEIVHYSKHRCPNCRINICRDDQLIERTEKKYEISCMTPKLPYHFDDSSLFMTPLFLNQTSSKKVRRGRGRNKGVNKKYFKQYY